MDVVATFYGLFTNFMDELGRKGSPEVKPVLNFLAAMPSCNYME